MISFIIYTNSNLYLVLFLDISQHIFSNLLQNLEISEHFQIYLLKYVDIPCCRAAAGLLLLSGPASETPLLSGSLAQTAVSNKGVYYATARRGT